MRLGRRLSQSIRSGVWYSLRLAANGKDEGFRDVLVIGGDHGDLPLTPESGALVAKMLAERAVSAVIDVSQFITGETSRFLRAFGEQFFESKKRHVSPVHMFLEECQVVVPQNPERDEAVMLARWERLIKFGRNYGCGFSMISQQPQSVNKKVLIRPVLCSLCGQSEPTNVRRSFLG